jgi:FkbM family methyltransferase
MRDVGQALSGLVRRAVGGWQKLTWGVRVVGVTETLLGFFRLAGLALRQPRHAEIRLRSGPVLEFDYPVQFPPILVVFRDLIDPEFPFLRRVARPDWTVVDVGAAIGQFSIFAASLGCARVHAFEPSSVNVATLARNVARNDAEARIAIHQLALSDTRGESLFETAGRAWMSRLDHSVSGEVVPVDTLDETAARLGLPHISVLKLNVAGFEPHVLAGARHVLADGRVDILILLLGLESLPWYERIAALGYRFFYYHPGRRMLSEVVAFDADSVLNHRPWPARHIIGIRTGALEGVLGTAVTICRPAAGSMR